MRMFGVAFMCVMVINVSSLACGGAPKELNTPLRNGSVTTFDFGVMKLHAYSTGDPLSDACFALESNDNTIAIESPAFADNIADWKTYLAGLDAPLTDIFLSYHPNGGKWFGSATSHATESTKTAITSGGTKAIIDNLHGAFGDAFVTDTPAIDKILPPGKNTIGGVEFEITNDADGFDIAIPAIKSVYIHMLGENVHSILVSTGHMDATIAKLEGFMRDDYTLILSSHHTPEKIATVGTKIAYIKKVKEIAAASANKDKFVEAVKAAFPGYAGDNYLDMTAGALFSN